MDPTIYSDSVIHMQMMRSDGDTTWTANLIRSPGTDTHSKISYDMKLIKSFVTEEGYHTEYFDKRNKMMFHYEFPRRGYYSFTFISGKYYFDYLYGTLNPKQKLFFETHEDSLIHVKGDKLPPLPF